MGGLVSPSPLVDAVDTPEVPTILRNQVITFGSKISGKALSSSGTSLIGYGVAQRNTPRPVRRYESVTKKSVLAKEGQLQKGTRYLPGSPRAANRQLHHSRYNRPVAKGSNTIRSGIALKGAGKLLPVLAVGFIGWDIYNGTYQPTTIEQDMDSIQGFTQDETSTLWSQSRDIASRAYFGVKVASMFAGIAPGIVSDLF